MDSRTRSFRPVDPDQLVTDLCDRVEATSTGVVRVLVDGPPAARPENLAAGIAGALPTRGRAAVVVRSELFWRDASLRLEYGREDVDSYSDWVDFDALNREVLDPVADGAPFLPSLRDPVTNRSTREPPIALGESGVLVISGALLLGRGLHHDLSIHLAMSPAARARRTPEDQQWTLPAFDRYDRQTRPEQLADVVVRYDDPRHPAIST